MVKEPSIIIWVGIDNFIIFGSIDNDNAMINIGLQPTILLSEINIAESEDALINTRNKEILMIK